MPESISPYGFNQAPSPFPIKTEVEYKRTEGDDEITELYRTHIQRKQNTLNWKYRSQVVDSAIRLLGTRKVSTFIGAQLRNPYLYGPALSFLDDSLAFAMGSGHRTMSLRNWSAIMDVDPAKKPIDVRRKLRLAPSPKDLMVEDLISQWISKENGFEDMLRTLYLMFGRKR